MHADDIYSLSTSDYCEYSDGGSASAHQTVITAWVGRNDLRYHLCRCALGAGLSSGNLGGGQTDADSCCKAYLAQMMEAVATVWINKQGIAGDVILDFAIERDGTVSPVEIRKSSGSDVLDLASLRAMSNARSPPFQQNSLARGS